MLRIALTFGLIVSTVIGTTLGFARDARAQGGEKLTYIRDAEIENTLMGWARPLAEAAGIDPTALSIHIVNDHRLNAFVAGGQRIFIFSGLLIRAEGPGQIKGVIAHEMGHIAGGHLARLQARLESATVESIIGALLAVGAAVAAGRGDVAPVIIGAQGTYTQRSLLQYTRTQEQAADQAAVTYLDSTGESTEGLEEFMRVLASQEVLQAGRQDPYLRTHPLGQERVAFLRSHVDNSPLTGTPEPPEDIQAYERMKAKLVGYLDPGQALKKYPESDTSIPARYARAIADYRLSRIEEALTETGALIAEEPDNPYFHELRGQILFENARIPEAIEAYDKAVHLAPRERLLMVSLAQALIERNEPADIERARILLEQAVSIDPNNSNQWRLLAVAYGRGGEIGKAHLSQAEYFYFRGQAREAIDQANRAQTRLPEGSPAWQRAEDIKSAARRQMEIAN